MNIFRTMRTKFSRKKHLPPGSQSCPFCGFTQFKTCGACGQPTLIYGKYCKACGKAQ